MSWVTLMARLARAAFSQRWASCPVAAWMCGIHEAITLRWNAGCTILRCVRQCSAFAGHQAVAEEDGDPLDADALDKLAW